ncbi:hypothetical protein D9619_006262 [Psilocybe cf. subviscida]|uniref:DUF6699 domain-containing protein n=1 Tax=Psilocybe cf. subviscida TaxID=2480587 RepID=A0A8H5B4T5_9AGAR|nr:hypothetical protein D9619_006262 [Psilocybe cf. subviscida]
MLHFDFVLLFLLWRHLPPNRSIIAYFVLFIFLMGLSRYLLPASWQRKLEWMMMDPKPPIALPRRVRVDLIPSAPSTPFPRRRRSRAARHHQSNAALWVPPPTLDFSDSPPIYPPVRPFATPDDDLDTWIKTTPPITVHPLLREGRIIWDIREEPHNTIVNRPPSEISTPLYLSANVAEQAVLCKSITHVSISLGHKPILSLERAWGPITVTAFQGKEVLVVDILRAIYAHFHKRLTKSEKRIFLSDPALTRTLERERNNRSIATGDIYDFHYRRCDLVEGLYKFDKLYFNSTSGRECRLCLKLKRK